jgi:hypothetical protein
MKLSKPVRILIGLATTWFALYPLSFSHPNHILQFVLIPFYLIHVIKNVTASETFRILLGVGLFFLPFVAMPAYYYLYIWLDQPPVWAIEGNAKHNESAVSAI